MKYHILFGFDDEEAVKAIIRIVKKQAKLEEIDYSIQTTKDAIQEYIKYNKDCTTIILREIMEGESWSAEEIAELNDWKNYNIIVVVDSSHKGTEYIQTLYTAGITNAFLVENGGFVTPGEIAHYVINPRNRASARKVYGMNSVKVPVNVLTSDVYLKKYAFLMDDRRGINFIDRYLMIVKDFSVKIAAEFTRRLPPNVIKKLVEYEEFWKVYEHFSNCGFKLNLKRPKQLRKGMTDEAFKSLMKRSGSKPEEVPAEYQKATFKEPLQEPLSATDPSQNYFDGMISLFDDLEKKAGMGGEQKPLSKEDPAAHSMVRKTADVRNDIAVSSKKNKDGSGKLPKKQGQKNVKARSATKVEQPKAEKSARSRTRINWKLVLEILVIAILLLAIFFLFVQLGLK